MNKMHVLQIGSRVHVLVPWNALYNARAVASVIPVQTTPAVFVPVNRG